MVCACRGLRASGSERANGELDAFGKSYSVPPMFPFRLSPLTRAFHRVVAVLGVALVLVLGAAGVSTELHAQLHGGCESAGGSGDHGQHHGHGHGHAHTHADTSDADQPAHQDEGCVVDLFAQGVASALEQPPVAAVQLIGESRYQTVADQAAPTKSAGWLPPVCGPPLK